MLNDNVYLVALMSISNRKKSCVNQCVTNASLNVLKVIVCTFVNNNFYNITIYIKIYFKVLRIL